MIEWKSAQKEQPVALSRVLIAIDIGRELSHCEIVLCTSDGFIQGNGEIIEITDLVLVHGKYYPVTHWAYINEPMKENDR